MPRCIARITCKKHQRNTCDESCSSRPRCKKMSQNSDEARYCTCHVSAMDAKANEKKAVVYCCPICYDNILKKDLTVLKCGDKDSHHHRYHKNCLSEWLKKGANTCPTCRTIVDERVMNKLAPYSRWSLPQTLFNQNQHPYPFANTSIVMQIIAAALTEIVDDA